MDEGAEEVVAVAASEEKLKVSSDVQCVADVLQLRFHSCSCTQRKMVQKFYTKEKPKLLVLTKIL